MVWEQDSNQTLQFFGSPVPRLGRSLKMWSRTSSARPVFFWWPPKTEFGVLRLLGLKEQQTRKDWMKPVTVNSVKLCEIMHIHKNVLNTAVKLLMGFWLESGKKESWLAWWWWTPCFLKNQFQPTNDWLDPTTMAPRTLIKNMPRATGIGPGKEKSDWDSKSNFTCFGKILSWVRMFSLGQSLHPRGNGYRFYHNWKGNSSSQLPRDMLVARKVTH